MEDRRTIIHVVKCPSCRARISSPLVLCRPCWARLDPVLRERIARVWTPPPWSEALTEAVMDAAKTITVVD